MKRCAKERISLPFRTWKRRTRSRVWLENRFMGMWIRFFLNCRGSLRQPGRAGQENTINSVSPYKCNSWIKRIQHEEKQLSCNCSACKSSEKLPGSFSQVHRKIRVVIAAIALISVSSQLLHLKGESAKYFRKGNLL